jgi:spore maturation protein CgeB
MKPLRLLVVGPGASWSTADVEAGLLFGLQHHGVDVIRYALDGRIVNAQKFLFTAWRLKKKSDPSLERPTPADVLYQASMGALERALRHQVDAVVVVSGMYLHPDVLVLMRRAGLLVTVMFTESPYDLEQELKVAQIAHGCWTNERTSVDAFRSVCPNSGYLPHAWHPERHRPGLQPGDEDVTAHDVVFVGSAFRERVEWFRAIDWTGIDLGLYGNWDALGTRDALRQFVRGKSTPNAVSAALYRRAKVGLNLYRSSKGFGRQAPRIAPASAQSLSPRAYELAACGAFHLSEARAEVREVFGDAVPTFTTATEAAALIRRWLADDAGRAAAAASLPAMVAESSWVHRASQVITDLTALVESRRRVA